MTDTAPARVGRPSLLTPAVRDTVANALRASTSVRLACQLAGISQATYHGWRSRGADEREALARDLGLEPDELDLDTVPDLRDTWPFLDFLESTNRALGDYQLENLARIQQAANGRPKRVTRTVEKSEVVGGTLVVTERTTTTTDEVEWSWQAAAWLLERRFPQEYGRMNRVEVSGPDGAPVEVENTAGQRLLAELDAMAERRSLAAAAIETTLTDQQ